MSYKVENGKVIYMNSKGEPQILANFVAKIKEEHKYIDGDSVDRFYVISGLIGDEVQPEVVVPAVEFSTMNWPSNAWGSQAIMFPGGGSKELLRTAIQLWSEPKEVRIYTHTGWTEIDGKPFYLTAGTAIGAKTRRTDISVKLPTDLIRYSLPSKPVTDPRTAIRKSLGLLNLGPKDVVWVALAAAYRSVIGPSDFAVHVTGRTGTFKSELASLIQSHFGSMSARELPASWNSTAAALEALAYRAKDALMVCDDFIPVGTSYQQKAYQTAADRLIRGQGNQAGRARLTDRSMMQQTMYPRGLIFSTGEDTPEGHSVRARMMIAELTPGEIKTPELSKAQKERDFYAESMALFIQWLAKDLKEKRSMLKTASINVRDENLQVGHSRTPPMLGDLIATISLILEFALEHKAITTEEANRLFDSGGKQITKLAHSQAEYLTAADPADQFISILRSIFAASAGHVKSKQGQVPMNPLLLGWTQVGDDGMSFKSHGPRLGWADPKENTLYLDAAVAYDTVRRHSRGAITLTRQTLYKRLREAGQLMKIDEQRQRNTIRVALEGAGRQVLAMNLTSILEGNDNG